MGILRHKNTQSSSSSDTLNKGLEAKKNVRQCKMIFAASYLLNGEINGINWMILTCAFSRRLCLTLSSSWAAVWGSQLMVIMILTVSLSSRWAATGPGPELSTRTTSISSEQYVSSTGSAWETTQELYDVQNDQNNIFMSFHYMPFNLKPFLSLVTCSCFSISEAYLGRRFWDVDGFVRVVLWSLR